MITMGEHTGSAKRAVARLSVIAAQAGLVLGGVDRLATGTPVTSE